MLERVVLSDHVHKNKAEGKLMTKDEKIDFVLNWKLENKEVLEDGGLGGPELGAVPINSSVEFCFQHQVHKKPSHFSSKYSKQMHAT
jgi:hypothetical protein